MVDRSREQRILDLQPLLNTNDVDRQKPDKSVVLAILSWLLILIAFFKYWTPSNEGNRASLLSTSEVLSLYFFINGAAFLIFYGVVFGGFWFVGRLFNTRFATSAKLWIVVGLVALFNLLLQALDS